MVFKKSLALQDKLNRLIPGGCHAYAKAQDRFPEHCPVIIERGEGCRVWDVDGNEYIEFGSGLRSVILGHGYKSVAEAAYRQSLVGNSFSRPAAIECEVAEHFLSLIRGAEMVKFAKNGSDVTSAAVRLSRAYTGRDLVAVCRDHPFFSVDDWFIGTTPMNNGVPEVVKGLTIGFSYNDIATVQRLFEQFPGRVACLILEAEKTEPPADDFLQQVQTLCRQEGTLLILDEIITGFRYHLRGAQEIHGLDPDLSTFGKGMGNGFSIAALAGKRDYMMLGGLDHPAERVFLLSATHAAEGAGLAASLETMKVCEREGVAEILACQGARLAAGVEQTINALNLRGFFGLAGRACCLTYWTRDREKRLSQEFQTLFLSETIKRGVLAPNFVVNLAHTAADIDRAVEAIAGALDVYRRALDEGIERFQPGRSVKPFLRAYN